VEVDEPHNSEAVTMLVLKTFGPTFSLPDPSTFCMKGMALLKLSGVPHRFEPGDIRKAPKGKIPWLEDGGKVIPDTTFIQQHLEEAYGVDFYPGLSVAEKAAAWAFEKMCEEHLYFCIVHERWMIDENFQKGPKVFFASAPAILRPLITAQVRRSIKQTLHGQGTGRHSGEEIAALADRDIESLSDFLGDKPYFMGETITGADAVVHAFVAGGLCPLFDGSTRAAVRKHPNLVSYAERLTEHWYGGTDWATGQPKPGEA
jgi:glutathione S-transferase